MLKISNFLYINYKLFNFYSFNAKILSQNVTLLFCQVQIDFLESEEIQCTGPPEETDPLLDVLTKKVEELVS